MRLFMPFLGKRLAKYSPGSSADLLAGVHLGIGFSPFPTLLSDAAFYFLGLSRLAVFLRNRCDFSAYSAGILST